MTIFSKDITKTFNYINKIFQNLSVWGHLLIIIVILLAVIIITKPFSKTSKIEGFTTEERFLIRTDSTSIYDEFYSEIYDSLVFNDVKDDYEIGEILRITTPVEKSRVLDIGCGTGHHVAGFAAENIPITGIDNSSAMIDIAKKNYPDLDFQLANALDGNTFRSDYFTHIICMYFTAYYFENKRQFFNNCINWLVPGGYLVVHLVDRDMFDPIIPPANPLITLTPQRYATERIMSSKVTFNNMKYNARFELDAPNDKAKFIEKFTMNDSSRVIQNEHTFHIPPQADILDIAKECGFIVHGKIDLIKSGYEYQYLYILIKPN